MPNAGDFVRVLLKDETLDGIVIPSEDNYLVIKLASGYNIGLENNKIKKVTVLKKSVSTKVKEEKQPAKANITILHTGGTIASKIDYSTGAVSAKFSPSELKILFPELKKFGKIRSILIGNFLSENIRFEHYNKLVKTIKKEINNTNGIIITHGTDTLHYTSAALSFMLQGINKPVVLVGAQRSSDRGSSDSLLNLVSAARFIEENIPGVFVCMHNSESDDSTIILKGVNCKKLHSSRRDAFKQINTKPVALISDKIKWIEKPKMKKEKFKVYFLKDLKIGMLKAHPHMFVEEIKLFEKFDGLIIEGTGLGHLPVEKFDFSTGENEKIFKELSRLAKKIPLFMTSQTINGRINMEVYSPGRKLKKLGVLGNYNTMTSETAFVKLAWAVSNFKNVEEVMMTNFYGENSDRLEDGF
jgi:glutamyl-tRNA(Gln) amidotransferase subunit D